METTEGIVGWGEPIVQGRLETVRTAVTELMEKHLIGADPLRIEHHWRTLYQGGYFRGGPVLMSALSGIDQALWDIKGRYHDCPVYNLLGGHVRDQMMVYAWVGGDTPSRVAEEADRLVEQGYRAIKLNLPMSEFRALETKEAIDNVVDHLVSIREKVDEEILVGIDFHGRVSRPMASKLIERLEPYDPAFIDQPTLPEHGDSMASIARRTSVPISTGERLYTRYDYKSVLTEDAATVIQPDVTHAGGITELRKIATLADTFDVAVVPHCPLSPVAFAASLQFDFATQNVELQEQDLDLHDPESSLSLRYLEDPDVFAFEDGYVKRPTGPGLGINIDEEYVQQRSQADVNWENPIWYYNDGRIAEW